jgi:plasmid maintenance system antidote protein VapI
MVEKDYREIIREEFLRRRGQNMTYTFGVFAKDIGVKRVRLHQVMSGAKGLTKADAFIVARKLGLNLNEAKEFRYLVSAQSGRSRYERNLANQWLKKKSSREERQRLG